MLSDALARYVSQQLDSQALADLLKVRSWLSLSKARVFFKLIRLRLPQPSEVGRAAPTGQQAFATKVDEIAGAKPWRETRARCDTLQSEW